MAGLSDISTAASGLAAAQRLINIAGQNISNASVAGYSRERVNLSSSVVNSTTGQTSAAVQGNVNVTSISRASSEVLNAAVRTATANSSYASTRSAALTSLETSTGTVSGGLNSQLTTFWSSWSTLANNTSSAADAASVISDGTSLASTISTGYSSAAEQWSSTRSDLVTQVATLNRDSARLASVNGQIQSAAAAGSDTSALLDQRDTLLTSIAGLVGGTTTIQADGTASVFVGGNVLVQGTTANQATVTGSTAASPSSSVSVAWSSNPSVSLGTDGGSIAGELSLISPATSDGTGGAISEAMAAYNSLATSLATSVNAIHSTGATTGGTTGLNFFSIGDSANAATTLAVVPADASGVAVAASGSGALDSSVADRISQLGTGSSSPDTQWSSYVTKLGTHVSNETTAASNASSALTSTTASQQSVSSVDLDEENEHLLTAQAAYQANARVITALDEMLNTLINKTGLVGISG